MHISGFVAVVNVRWHALLRAVSHEPVLNKFREIKAFSKKIQRALGRNEISTAKALHARRPIVSVDHLVKERYPTCVRTGR